MPGGQTLLFGSKQSIFRHRWRGKVHGEQPESGPWELPAAPACPGLPTRALQRGRLLPHQPRAPLALVQAKSLEIIASSKCLQETVGYRGSQHLSPSAWWHREDTLKTSESKDIFSLHPQHTELRGSRGILLFSPNAALLWCRFGGVLEERAGTGDCKGSRRG